MSLFSELHDNLVHLISRVATYIRWPETPLCMCATKYGHGPHLHHVFSKTAHACALGY